MTVDRYFESSELHDPGSTGSRLRDRRDADSGEAHRSTYQLGALSTGEHRFYERIGWERWQGPTLVRAGGELIRTPDEDDGIMVMRFGSSTGVDLSAPIVCDVRPGEVW